MNATAGLMILWGIFGFCIGMGVMYLMRKESKEYGTETSKSKEQKQFEEFQKALEDVDRRYDAQRVDVSVITKDGKTTEYKASRCYNYTDSLTLVYPKDKDGNTLTIIVPIKDCEVMIKNYK